MPGETLPLRIRSLLDVHAGLRGMAVEQALAAPPPLARLIAVVRGPRVQRTLPRLITHPVSCSGCRCIFLQRSVQYSLPCLMQLSHC